MSNNRFKPLQFLESFQNIGVIYEDNHVLVIHKPRNIPVQADDSQDVSIQQLIQEFLKQKYQKPGNVFVGIVHRLDRPVSGLMVFAKTSKAASRLSEQMRQHSFSKSYAALVQGVTPTSQKLINFLVKNEKTNTVSVVKKGTENAKEAILSFETLVFKDGISLIKIDLQTGRPHQIRVQLAHFGFPLLGDAKYGNEKGKTDQIELKSIELGFEHPTTKEKLFFEGIDCDTNNWKKFC